MAIVMNSIGTSSGRDFATLALWMASLPPDFVAAGNSYTAMMYNDSEITWMGDYLHFQGFTTDATHFATITAAPGHAWCDSIVPLSYNASNGVSFRELDHRGNGFFFEVPYTVVNRLQINAANLGIFIRNYGIITNCLIEANNECLLLTPNNLIANNVLIVRSNVAIQLAQVDITTSIINNTFVRPGLFNGTSIAISNDYGKSYTCINNCIFGFGGISNNSGLVGNNNATDLTTIIGSSNDQLSLVYADQFFDVTADHYDYRIKPGSAITTGGIATSVALDVFGAPRGPAYSIGAQQFVSYEIGTLFLSGAITSNIFESQTTSPFRSITVTDVNIGAIDTVTITTNLPEAGHFTTLAGFVAQSDGSYTFNGSPSVVQAALRAVVFTPTVGGLAANAGNTVILTVNVSDERLSVTNSLTQITITGIGAVTNSIGTSPGRDFATLALWMASLPVDFVAAGNCYTAMMYNDSEITWGTGTYLEFNGFTTDATHFATITAAPGHAWCDSIVPLRYNARNGVSLRELDHRNNGLFLYVPYTVVSRLQINAAHYGILLGNSGTITNCLVEASDICVVIANSFVANNVLIVGGNWGLSIRNANANCNIIDNTIIYIGAANNTVGAIENNYGLSYTCINNCIFGFPVIFDRPGLVGSNNATDLSSFPGSSNNEVSLVYNNQFVNTTLATYDFRIAASGSDIAIGGVATSVALDVFGVPRGPAYSIGAHQFVSGQVLSPPQKTQWPFITWVD